MAAPQLGSGHRAGRRPAGPRRAEAPVADDQGEVRPPSATSAPGGRRRGRDRPRDGPATAPAGRPACLDERARPRLEGPDLALQLGRRAAAGRAGRRRGGTAAPAVAPVGRLRARRSLAAQPRAQAGRSSRSAAMVGQAGFELRRRLAAVRSASRRCATSGPVSRPASIRIRLTPVTASPATIARATGVAPRHRGSSDGMQVERPVRAARRRRARAADGRSRPGR